ncbi:MAG: SGNH/GDSL hydrolase family protein [Bacteroidetes bacterium]|jgi:lysophospholipase L1-like esterase|nr:SGNH/GDSL hydrolase family protein [Bacteroidota bacterium]
MNYYRLSILLAFVLSVLSCEKDDFAPDSAPSLPKSAGIDTLHYLALGDSYTIGEGVKYNENFPSQLTEQVNGLHGDSLYLLPPTIVAQTGWTAAELGQRLEQENLRPSYDVITLLIGVNNQYQRQAFSKFEEDYRALLEFALSKTEGDSSRLVLMSIPDYAYTPFGQDNVDPARTSTEIDKYNAYIEQQAVRLGLPFVNITDISREGLDKPELVASDGLHPSEQMYARWVERLLDYVIN